MPSLHHHLTGSSRPPALFARRGMRGVPPQQLRGGATAATAAAPSAAASQGAMALSSSVSHSELVAALRAVVPELDYGGYKGQAGKVGVIGGCREYTGAPYFAAMSAMRMGCDLAYVFCAPSAAAVIKGYSPELIVVPALPEEEANAGRAESKFESRPVYGDSEGNLKLMPRDPTEQERYFKEVQVKFMSRLSALIIGPGLGDYQKLKQTIVDSLAHATEHGIPVVIDGSGLNFIAQQPELVRGHSNVLLTPNMAEFGRLAEAVGLKLPGEIGTHWQQHAKELAAALGGPVLLSKGPVDIITDGQQQLVVSADGSPRRCGGQGDVLTGTTASFISWLAAAQRREKQQQKAGSSSVSRSSSSSAAALPPLMLAAYGGCLTMRAAAVLAYRQRGRSLVAGDMIEHLGDAALQQAGLVRG